MQINKSKVVHVIITDNSQKTEINHHCSDDITDFLEYSNILSYKIYIKYHKLGIFFCFLSCIHLFKTNILHKCYCVFLEIMVTFS